MFSLKHTLFSLLLAAAPTLTQAASVTVTIEDAGVMEADVSAFGATGSVVETFDDLTRGHFTRYESALGTYSAGRVDATNQYGGADASQYLFSQNRPGTSLSLNTPATYFGLWWSAGSVRNQIDLYSNGMNIFSFNTDDVLTFLTDNADDARAYYGNPNARYAGRVTHEPFVFINLFSDTLFDTVVLSGPNFESDNHTIATHYSRLNGTAIAPIPLPSSLPLLAGATAICAIMIARRRKSQTEE